MITEQALQEAIAECQGERNPNANTCLKLASYYTIRNELFGNSDKLAHVADNATAHAYSYAPPPEAVESTISYSSDTEFGRLVGGRNPDEVWPVVDELISVVQALNPRLYKAFIQKLL